VVRATRQFVHYDFPQFTKKEARKSTGIYSMYIKVDILTVLEKVKNEAVVNDAVRTFIVPNTIIKGRVLQNVP
jgi:hypothetical protein